jgi:hypothetical protein
MLSDIFGQSEKPIYKVVADKFKNQSYASYKTKFERGLFAVNISVDNNSKINGLFVKPFNAEILPKIVRNQTKLTLPFNDTWNVFWGGDTKELN